MPVEALLIAIGVVAAGWAAAVALVQVRYRRRARRRGRLIP